MARVGFSTADMSQGSAGIQAGSYEVVDAKCKIHQFPANSKTGKQSDSFMCAQLDFAPLDENGNRKKDEEPTALYFRVGDVKDFHPGNVDPDEKDNLEAEVEDAGEEVDCEGNTIFGVDPAKRLFAKMPWQLFTSSLEAQGFKPEILGRGYMPDLVGTKVELETIARTYKDKGTGEDKTGTDVVVKHIIERPYERKNGAKPSSKPVAGKAAGKTVSAPAPVEDDTHDQAVKVVAKVGKLFDGMSVKRDKNVRRDEFQRQVLSACMKERIPAKQQAAIIKLVKDDSELQMLFIEAELGTAAEGIGESTIQF